MTHTQILQQLRQLKLSGMADGQARQLEQTDAYDNLPFIERLHLLFDEENLARTNRKQDRLSRQAHFKLKASVHVINYQHPRSHSLNDGPRLMALSQATETTDQIATADH